jgi:AcrR family transcriptional regulator
MVAAQAKVSVPTVFHYFANSDALVDAVLVEVERLYTMALLSVSELSLPPDQVLDTLTRTLVATIDSHPDHVQILTEWSISSRSPLWPRYVKLYRKMVRAVAKVIERGQAEGLFRADVNAEDEAAILYAVSRAFIQMKALGASPERFESFLRSVMQSVAVESKTKSKTGSKKATATLARLRKPSPASTKSGTSR